MNIKQETVFRCEFCNKAMLGKGAMSLHERMCKKNPKNKHKCFQYCKWLNKDADEVTGLRFFCCGNDKCKLHEKDLYSYKLERNYSGQQRIKEEELTLMPLECDNYDIESGHEEKWVRGQNI